MSQSTIGGLGGGVADYITSNFNELRVLLDVDEPFRYLDVEEHVTAPKLESWARDGILRVVDTVDEGNTVYRRYRVTDSVRDRLEEMAEHSRLAPCGHRGISNLGDDVFSCASQECDSRFGRDTAVAIVNGGEQA